MDLLYKDDSRGVDTRKLTHEARDRAKYHEKKQKKGRVTTLIDTRQRAYVQIDGQHMRMKVVKLQDDRGYDSLTEEEKYTVISKAMQAKASGQEDLTIPLKYEDASGINYQKKYRNQEDSKRKVEVINQIKDESSYHPFIKGKKASKRNDTYRNIREEIVHREDKVAEIC